MDNAHSIIQDMLVKWWSRTSGFLLLRSAELLDSNQHGSYTTLYEFSL